MKKKSQKFRNFIASSNSVNYRDKHTIAEHFNNSIRLYKRFEDILSAGDERLAAEKLRNAGPILYQSCEWAFKYYLDMRYCEMCIEGVLSQNDKVKKIEFLTTRDCNLCKLLKEFKSIAIPSPKHVGINCDIIFDFAGSINNKPKHEAAIPDPNEFKKALGEIRKIIHNYVDKDVILELIEDTIYGEEKGWYEILEDTSDFSSAFTYILVTKRVEGVNVKGLFSQKWDLVIDFDPSTDANGLQHDFKQISGINPWIRLLNNIDSKRKFSYSNIPYWIMANGNIDNGATICESYQWKNRYGRFLNDLLEKFYSVYTKPAKVFIFPSESEKNLESVVDSFNAIYDCGENVNFCVLSL